MPIEALYNPYIIFTRGSGPGLGAVAGQAGHGLALRIRPGRLGAASGHGEASSLQGLAEVEDPRLPKDFNQGS